jgi:glycosyltransferase involved in cell wall biosynthesis
VKKNVLQLVGSFHQGGSERQAVQLVKLLHREATCNIFLAALNKEGILRDEVEKIGFTEIPEFKLTSFYDLNFARQLQNCVRFLKENKIEIIHTHDFYTNVFGIAAARLAGVPVKIASKRETGGMRSNLQKRIEKRVFSIADAIVVNAEAVKNYLSGEGVSPEKIELIYNGIDLERLAPKETDRRKICEELNLPADENIKFITLVANLRHAVKNQPMFLRVAQRLYEKFPDAQFVLAGEGELKRDLENLAKELGIAENTHFVGRCAKIPELLCVSFAGVLTSHSEGFSNSILEYMAAKLPVVATNVGGASEAISESETGFLVESNDDAAMANRLSELLQNPEQSKKMGELGRKKVEENFSCAAQLEKTINLYDHKLNEKLGR